MEVSIHNRYKMNKVKYSMPIDQINILIDNQQRFMERQVEKDYTENLNTALLNITGWKESLLEELTDLELPENVSVVALKSAKDLFETKDGRKIGVRVRPMSYQNGMGLKGSIEYYMEKVVERAQGHEYSEIVMAILLPVYYVYMTPNKLGFGCNLKPKAMYADYYVVNLGDKTNEPLRE